MHMFVDESDWLRRIAPLVVSTTELVP